MNLGRLGGAPRPPAADDPALADGDRIHADLGCVRGPDGRRRRGPARRLRPIAR